MALVTLTPAFTGTATLTVTTAKPTLTGLGSLPINVTTTPAATPAVLTVTALAPLAFTGTASASATVARTRGLRVKFTGTASVVARIPKKFVPDVSTGRPPYRVVLVDAASQAALGEVESATFGAVSQTLNAPGSFSFTMAANDAKATLVRPNLTEVKVFRGAQLHWWGVITRASRDGVNLSVQAAGLLWYLSRRVIGKIPRDQLLVNPDFEQGEAGWTFSWVPGSLPPVPPEHSISSDALTGDQALQITGASATVIVNNGLLASVLFYPNSSTLLPGGEAAILEVAKLIPNPPDAIEIIGHTSNDGTGNGLALSAARANVVKNVILTVVPGAPITAKGVGYFDPDPQYAINAPEQRRVEINYSGLITAKGNKQWAGQTLTYTNTSTRKMRLTLVGWFKVLAWTDAGIGYGAELEAVDPAPAKPVVSLAHLLAAEAADIPAPTGSTTYPAEVIVVEQALNSLGYLADQWVDGSWGTMTRAAYQTWQTACGQASPNGTPDMETLEKLALRFDFIAVDSDPTQIIASATVQLDAYTPLGSWQRQECSIEIPADGKPYTINVRLHPPSGTVLWDTVALTEDTAFEFNSEDQATIVERLVELAQDEDLGKSDLGILTHCPPTGVERTRVYPWADRKPTWEALAEFPTLLDGMDIDLNATRTLTTYYPRKGTNSGYVLALGSNVATYSLDDDGEQTATTIVVQSTNGAGSGREEGVIQDADPLDGIVLERVYQAPIDSSVGTLITQAQQGWDRYSHPVTIPQVTCLPSFTTELLNTLDVGDRVRLIVPGVDATYRIIGQSLDPAADQMSYTLAEE